MGRNDTPPIGIEEMKRHVEALFKFETASKKPDAGDAKPTVASLASLAALPTAPASPAAAEGAAEAGASVTKLLSFRDAKKNKKRD